MLGATGKYHWTTTTCLKRVRHISPWPLVGFLLLLGSFFTLASSVSAETTHKFEARIPQIPVAGPSNEPIEQPGPLGEATTLVSDSGSLYINERSRVDQFKLSAPYGFEAQLPGYGLEDGLGFSSVGNEKKLLVGSGTFTIPSSIQVFGDACGRLMCVEPQETWTGLQIPGKSFGGYIDVATDSSNDVEDWARGDVIVAAHSTIVGASPQNVVYALRPKSMAEGGGEEYVMQLTGTPLENEPATIEPFESPRMVAVSELNGDLLVVDVRQRGSVVDLFRPVEPMPGSSEYTFVRQLQLPPPSSEFTGITGTGITAIAVDGGSNVNADDGDMYVARRVAFASSQGGAIERTVIYEFNKTGTLVGSFKGEELSSLPNSEESPPGFEQVTAMSVDPSTHKVFVADEINGDRGVDVFGSNETTPEVEPLQPSSSVLERGQHAWRVQLNGIVNPENAGNVTCSFVWGTLAVEDVKLCEGEGSPTTPIASSEGQINVHTGLKGLQPDTTYHYLLEATNAQGTNKGEEFQPEEFTTPGPGLHSESVAEVSASSVTFKGALDPNGDPTSYRFEYGISTYEASVGERSIGSGARDVSVETHVQNLLPRTTYHYRMVAVSEVEPGVREEFYGPDHAFNTQNGIAISGLPDGRAWELVSPVNKHGALVLGLVKPEENVFQAPTQASSDGHSMTYVALAPTQSDVSGYSSVEQVLSTRSDGGSGWSSRNISPSHDVSTGNENYPEYEFFAEDLSQSMVNLTGLHPTLLSEQASEATPYMRIDSCEPPSTGEECYVPLISAKAGEDQDVPAGTVFGGDVQFVGSAPGMDHVVLRSDVPLTGAPTGSHIELYEWSKGQPADKRLQLISVLPEAEGGGPASDEVDLGNDPHEKWASGVRAISNDGSRVFWSAGGTNGARLYMYDETSHKSIRLDVPQSGPAVGGATRFEFASADGSRVYFTDEARLVPEASLHGADLYECEIVTIAAAPDCVLKDLTAGGVGASAEVQNLALGGEDGSYAYFVANGVLPGSGAPNATPRGACKQESNAPTTCNLYAYHAGHVRFIATLSSEDQMDWGTEQPAKHTVGELTARVSPDGEYFAFMSVRSLTGYDNLDVRNGQPDAEVYLYSARTEHLVCASCNPTGMRPLGVYAGEMQADRDGGDVAALAGGTWVAANLPAGNAVGRYNESLYMSRSLDDTGRLFFNSSDSLVASDTNGQEDVYEYEPSGIGSCTQASSTYSEASSGCVALISSGTSSGESGFLDASADGNDAFFLTGEALVTEDDDTAFDVYDAHVCNAGEQCGGKPIAPPPCNTVENCRGSASEQPLIYGPPPSATFSGTPETPQTTVIHAPVAKGSNTSHARRACHQAKRGRGSRCARHASKRSKAKRGRRERRKAPAQKKHQRKAG